MARKRKNNKTRAIAAAEAMREWNAHHEQQNAALRKRGDDVNDN
jgi:hypothetical protein